MSWIVIFHNTALPTMLMGQNLHIHYRVIPVLILYTLPSNYIYTTKYQGTLIAKSSSNLYSTPDYSTTHAGGARVFDALAVGERGAVVPPLYPKIFTPES